MNATKLVTKGRDVQESTRLHKEQETRDTLHRMLSEDIPLLENWLSKELLAPSNYNDGVFRLVYTPKQYPNLLWSNGYPYTTKQLKSIIQKYLDDNYNDDNTRLVVWSITKYYYCTYRFTVTVAEEPKNFFSKCLFYTQRRLWVCSVE
jgi:ABC-type transport system substrate-binding protein